LDTSSLGLAGRAATFGAARHVVHALYTAAAGDSLGCGVAIGYVEPPHRVCLAPPPGTLVHWTAAHRVIAIVRRLDQLESDTDHRRGALETTSGFDL
jgi:hypothetical protein